MTVVMPCFGRPARTRRMINCILSQTAEHCEIYVVGDGCPHFQTIIDSGEAEFYKEVAKKRNNTLHIFNNDKNVGGYGTSIIQSALVNAKGRYFMILGNDDIILPNHFEHYLNEIENSKYELVYFNTYMKPTDSIRSTKFEINHIGHSEIIFKVDIGRKITYDVSYGHDWRFIHDISKHTNRIKKAASIDYTYIVMHIPGHKEEIID